MLGNPEQTPGTTGSGPALSNSSPLEGVSAPKQEFQLAGFAPGRPPSEGVAREIADLFVRVYGTVHNRPFLLDPKILIAKVENGDLYPFVARNSDGLMVAHTAVVNLGEGVFEIDFQLADPAYRGKKVGSVLRDLALNRIEALHHDGIANVFRADCVTSHGITQKYGDQIKMQVTGIFDRKYPDFFTPGRDESVVRIERILTEPIKNERTVYVPSTLRAIAEHIYTVHGCQRTVNVTPSDAAVEATPRIDSDTHERQAFETTSLTVTPGVSAAEISAEAAAQFRDGAKHLSVRVDITHPASIYQINVLRGLGFYFASLEMKANRDYMQFQKLRDLSGPCCPGEVNIYSPDARKLLELIRESQTS